MDSEPGREVIAELYAELERLSDEYKELTDTDVREALHLTLNYYFVWGKAQDRLPIAYEMWTREGDQAVAQAVKRFLTATDGCPEISSLPIGQLRLNLLQDRSIRTPRGEQYDLFIGHSDEPSPPDPLPPDMFEEPDYESFSPY